MLDNNANASPPVGQLGASCFSHLREVVYLTHSSSSTSLKLCRSVPKSVEVVLFDSLARSKCIPIPPFPLLLDTPLHRISWVFSEVRDTNSDEYHLVKEIIRRN